MKYILIFMLYQFSIYGPGSTATAIEFDSLSNCEKAALIVKDKFAGGSQQFYSVCVPK